MTFSLQLVFRAFSQPVAALIHTDIRLFVSPYMVNDNLLSM